LNVAGFYDPLIALLDHTVAESFAAPQHERLVVVEKSVDALLDALEAWRPPPIGDKTTDRRTNP
jgi:predicted Rossmann-fold nucleotide-binding protein